MIDSLVINARCESALQIGVHEKIKGAGMLWIRIKCGSRTYMIKD